LKGLVLEEVGQLLLLAGICYTGIIRSVFPAFIVIGNTASSSPLNPKSRSQGRGIPYCRIPSTEDKENSDAIILI
jgi:hypothetical protein